MLVSRFILPHLLVKFTSNITFVLSPQQSGHSFLLNPIPNAMRYSDYITNQEDLLLAPNQLNLALARLVGEKWETMHLVLFDVDPRLKFDECGNPSVRMADLPNVLEAIGRRVALTALAVPVN